MKTLISKLIKWYINTDNNPNDVINSVRINELINALHENGSIDKHKLDNRVCDTLTNMLVNKKCKVV